MAGVIIGLDIGDKRIGVAVSDESGSMAMTHETLIFQSKKKLLAALKALASEMNSEQFVVGHPLNLNGTEGDQSLKVKELTDWLRTKSSFTWTLWDERLSTQEANRLMILGEVKKSKKKEMRDQIAAQRILQSYLDNKRHQEAFTD